VVKKKFAARVPKIECPGRLCPGQKTKEAMALFSNMCSDADYKAACQWRVNNPLMITDLTKQVNVKCMELLVHSSFCHWNDEEVMLDVVGEAIVDAAFRAQLQMTQDSSMTNAINAALDQFPKSYIICWNHWAQQRAEFGVPTDVVEPINEDPN
jgi:hypothetical protein